MNEDQALQALDAAQRENDQLQQRIQAQEQAVSSGENELRSQIEALVTENKMLSEQLQQTKEQVCLKVKVGVSLICGQSG